MRRAQLASASSYSSSSNASSGGSRTYYPRDAEARFLKKVRMECANSATASKRRSNDELHRLAQQEVMRQAQECHSDVTSAVSVAASSLAPAAVCKSDVTSIGNSAVSVRSKASEP